MTVYSKAAWLPLLPLSALTAGLLLISAQAQAQPSANAAEPRPVHRADPADPQAVTPPLAYPSSLGRYQTFTEAEVAPWRETNERVRQRGGWRAYAREAQEPAVTPQAPSQPAVGAKPAMPGHAGHGMK